MKENWATLLEETKKIRDLAHEKKIEWLNKNLSDQRAHTQLLEEQNRQASSLRWQTLLAVGVGIAAIAFAPNILVRWVLFGLMFALAIVYGLWVHSAGQVEKSIKKHRQFMAETIAYYEQLYTLCAAQVDIGERIHTEEGWAEFLKISDQIEALLDDRHKKID